jgi:hypothetical protein
MEQPTNIKFCFKLGKTATEAQTDLETLYKKGSPISYTHIYFTEHSHAHHRGESQ